MSYKEMEQISVFEHLVRKEITQRGAAEMLGLTVRQVRNKLRDYEKDGAQSLAHKSGGRASPKRWCEKEEKRAFELLNSDLWQDFGPTFAAEKLAEYEGIYVSSETLRKRMIYHGLRKVRSRRTKKRKMRERKRLFGSLTQLDGSKHTWFFGAKKCSLLVFIDDATSKLLYLEFVPSESRKSVMLATRRYMEKYGRPRKFYVDRASVFKVNVNNPENDKLTQWERAMGSLYVKISHAQTPQGKGRVERANKTLQDRLIKELRLRGIASMEQANKYVSEFMNNHNKRFSVCPAENQSAYRSLDDFDLDDIFCIYETRIVQNDYTILYSKRIFQLQDTRNITFKPRDEVTVKESFDGTIRITIRGYELEYKELQGRPKKPIKEKVYLNQQPKKVPKHKRWNNSLLFKKKQYYYQPRVY